MKRIEKLAAAPEDVRFDGEATAAPAKVQGGERTPLADGFSVVSGGRFKLETNGRDFVRIREGSGHIKWARGEFPFSEGDILLVSEAGEYEICGRCRFTVIRRP